MAEERIGYKDLIDPKWSKPFLTDLKKIEAALRKVAVEHKKSMLKADDKGSKKRIDDIKKTETVTKQLNAVTVKRKKLEQQITEAEHKSNTELERKRQKLAEVKRATKETVQVERAAEGSINKLKLANRKLVKEMNELNLATDKGRQVLKRKQQQIKKNETQLKRYDKAIGRSQRNVGNYASAMGGLTKMLGVFGVALGGAAIIGFFRKSLRNLDMQMKAEKALEVALGKSSKALLTQASALQAQTRYGDEATIQGMAFLAQMKLNETAIARITPFILDFAEAQGMALPDAFKLVAKSVGSSTNALSRYGLTIEGGVGTNERLESAVTALSTAFKGQAAAAAGVGLGAMQQMSNLWGDMTERVGGFLARALLPLVKGMSSLLGVSESHIEVLRTEQAEINLLINSVMSVNENEEMRLSLLKELNEKYPDLLENIDLEKISNEELRDILISVNDEYIKRIKIFVIEKELAKNFAESTELWKEQREIIKTTTAAYDKYIKDKQEGLTFEEKAQALTNQNLYDLLVIHKEWAEIPDASGALEIQDVYNAKITSTKDRMADYNTAQTKRNELQAEYNDLLTEKIDVGYVPKKKEKTPTDEITEAGVKPVELLDVDAIQIRTDKELQMEEARNLAMLEMRVKLHDDLWGADEAMHRELEAARQQNKDNIFVIEETAALQMAELKDEIQEEDKIRFEDVQEYMSENLTTMLNLTQQYFAQQVEMIQQEKAHELAIAGSNADARASIEAKYQAEIAKAKRKQVKAQKAEGIFSAIINTAKGVTGALAQQPPWLGIALSILVGVLGAAQIALIASQPLPTFHKGIKRVGGDKKAGQMYGLDSKELLAILHEDERVISPEDNYKLGDVDNKDLPELVSWGKLWRLNFGDKTIKPFSFYGDFSRLESLQQDQLDKQDRTNELLAKHKIIYPSGKIEDMQGNLIYHV